MFGQLVIGPPGSGKTTYCQGMQDFLTAAGRRVAVVNLDPANDGYRYTCQLDISDLVDLSAVQEQLGLGPNGGMLYCMDHLAANLDWLDAKIKDLRKEYMYFLFDLPGQAELFTHHGALQQIVAHLTNKLNCRLACVHLVDAGLCTDASKYISALLSSLTTMLHLELPHINVLSKVDLLKQRLTGDDEALPLETFTECDDLSAVLGQLKGDVFSEKYRRLAKELVDVVEGYGLVSFIPLDVQDRRSVAAVLEAVDTANGYMFGGRAAEGRGGEAYARGEVYPGGAGEEG